MMIGMFDQSDFLILFRLIAAHMIAEWVFGLAFWKHVQSVESWLLVFLLRQNRSFGLVRLPPPKTEKRRNTS